MRIQINEALTLTSEYGTHECHLFRERIFSAHEFLSLSLARHYVRIAKKKSYVEANVELRRLHKVLTLGSSFQGLFIDSPDEDVKLFAEQKTLTLIKSFSGFSKRYGPKRALKNVIEKLNECDLEFPLADPDNASEEEIAGAIARCFDPSWWRRKIRSHQDLILEHVQIMLGLVNKQKGIYASNHCVQRKLAQWKRNDNLLASLEAENDLGQVFNMLDLAKRGMANLTNRRNELMTRLAGFEAIAKDQNDEGVFYTLTAPSKYHSYIAKTGRPNSKYQGASPAETQDYMNLVWQRIRAKLKRLNIQPYGFRVVEPHHDGTPHWHLLLFVPPEQVSTLSDVIKHYSLEEDGTESGAQKSRVKIEHIDPNKGSAVGYIAKYIAKNIDGEHVGADHYGFDAVESATRIRAWASNWKIRQFQSIGGPSVTVWREVRQFANSDAASKVLDMMGDDHLKALVEAADTGDWKAFVKLSGGPTAARKDQPLRALHIVKDKPNKYGEAVNQILGLSFKVRAELKPNYENGLFELLHRQIETTLMVRGFLLAVRMRRPWSSVNNCTVKDTYRSISNISFIFKPLFRNYTVFTVGTWFSFVYF